MLVAAFFIAFAFATLGFAEDPCLPQNYRELTDIYRSTKYSIQRPFPPLCDDMLDEGWYRFNTTAGNRMADTCVAKTMCGTIVPLYMNGQHPTIEEEVAERNVCANVQGSLGQNSCCGQATTIRVKNCTDFFVYYLLPTPGCPMSYCIDGDGQGIPCPPGKWSEHGNLEPDCLDAFPVYTNQPQFSGPHIINSTFSFSCGVHINNDDMKIAFEVSWTFDGYTDANIESTILRHPKRTAELDGSLLHGHLGKYIGCQARVFYLANPNQRSPWIESEDSYWAGIKIEPTRVVIEAETQNIALLLTSTLPLVCDDESRCVLTFMLAINASHDVIKIANTCKYQLTITDWNNVTKTATKPVSVHASRDLKQSAVDAQLEFHRIPDTYGEPYFGIFNGFLLNTVQLQVKTGDTKICKIETDPHFTGIEKNYFDLFTVGDYTAFINTNMHFEVQIRTWPCNGGSVTCVCGVAIREVNDVIRILGCDKSYYSAATHTGSPDIQTFNLREATVILGSIDGSQIVVQLPSGAEISVNAYDYYGGHFNVILSIPSVFKGVGKGLCGTYDDVNNNEYMHRDGSSTGSWSQSFLDSWNNTHSTSLFRDEILQTHYVDDYISKYCTCTNGSIIECPLRSTAETNLLCPSCVAKNIAKIFDTTQRRSTEAVFADIDDVTTPYDPDDYKGFRPSSASWPTANGTTENMAERKCHEALEELSVWPHCTNQTKDIENIISGCKEDIMFSDSIDILEPMKNTFTMTCAFELAKDPDNYVSTPDGESIVKPEISTDLCNAVCLLHGHCVAGQCECDNGYKGVNCQLLQGIAPELVRIRGSNLCDINEKPCRTVFVDVDNIERNDSLSCKVTEILNNGAASTDSFIEKAAFLTAKKIACAVPSGTAKSVKVFMISITLDGILYSNTLNLTLFDSTCQNCSDAGCTKLPATCLINDLCFQDHDENPNDDTQFCNATSNELQWSSIPSDYPIIKSVNLFGPVQYAMVCSVNSSDTHTTRAYKVTWFINGQPISIEFNMAAQSSQSIYVVGDLPSSGILLCKVRSYYRDRNIYSPYVQSNTFDIASVPRIHV